ncbi:hypothetical protein A2U01_0110914, partial [Trifolium medium]|nr:hypothetical protein [Trifolium medium]
MWSARQLPVSMAVTVDFARKVTPENLSFPG